MSGAERERRLRDALKRLISAYGRTARAQESAVKHAQRVLEETASRKAAKRDPASGTVECSVCGPKCIHDWPKP